MGKRKTYGPDSDYLRMDRDDIVHVCRPDDSSTPIGHVASPRTDDACPEELRNDLAYLYADFVRGLRAMPSSGKLPWVKPVATGRIAV